MEQLSCVVRIEMKIGCHIREAARQAILMAERLGCRVAFDFNGHEFCCSAKDRVDHIEGEYEIYVGGLAMGLSDLPPE